jgi:hypothetical protein
VTSANCSAEQADLYVLKIHYLNDIDLGTMERDCEKDIGLKEVLSLSQVEIWRL